MRKLLGAVGMFVGGAVFGYAGMGKVHNTASIIGGGIDGLMFFGLCQIINWLSLRADRRAAQRDSLASSDKP